MGGDGTNGARDKTGKSILNIALRMLIKFVICSLLLCWHSFKIFYFVVKLFFSIYANVADNAIAMGFNLKQVLIK
jgi:hypothetical protein